MNSGYKTLAASVLESAAKDIIKFELLRLLWLPDTGWTVSLLNVLR
jgi:hypothetical protein